MSDSIKLLKELIQKFSERGDFLASSVLLEDAQVGKSIPESHLNKIRKWTRTEIDVERIHTFPVLMIDTAPTRNMVIYTEKSQRKSVKSWIGKTFLFNSNGAGNVGFLGQADHSLQAASQMARIYDAKIVKTPNNEIGTLGWFYSVKGIDETVDGFIEKLEAGILREVSIHVSVPDGVVCSIDGKQFQSWRDDRTTESEKVICFDHIPGEKYGKQMCYLSTGEGKLDPLELSAVACPGSINAHVMKDDDVENYPAMSLREALGGSQQAKEIIMAQISEEAASALKKIQEAAALAGVPLAETPPVVVPPIASESDESKEAKAKEDEEKRKKDEEEAAKARANEESAKIPPVVETESVHLFDGDCPACGSKKESNTESESQKITNLRKGFKEQVQIIVETATEQIKKADEYKEKAGQFDTLFASYCADVAKLAVESGMKKSHECDKYVEDLQKLSFQAVEEIKKALLIPRQEKAKEEHKQSLVKSMQDRAKEMLGETKVEETKDGKKATVSENRPKFGLK